MKTITLRSAKYLGKSALYLLGAVGLAFICDYSFKHKNPIIHLSSLGTGVLMGYMGYQSIKNDLLALKLTISAFRNKLEDRLE